MVKGIKRERSLIFPLFFRPLFFLTQKVGDQAVLVVLSFSLFFFFPFFLLPMNGQGLTVRCLSSLFSVPLPAVGVPFESVVGFFPLFFDGRGRERKIGISFIFLFHILLFSRWPTFLTPPPPPPPPPFFFLLPLFTGSRGNG